MRSIRLFATRIAPSFLKPLYSPAKTRKLTTAIPTSSIQSTASSAPRLSAFTGKPDFYEAFFLLDDILLQLQPLERSLSITAGQSIQWHEREEMSGSLGFSLSTLQYRKIKDKLALLACHSNLPEIRQFLLNFTQDPTIRVSATENDVVEKKATERKNVYGHIDELGRAVAKGKRKSSTARVLLVDGEGLMYVNGKPVAEYFHRMNDMFKVAEPLRATSAFGKYNIWALVRGGGQTGTIKHMSYSQTLLGQSGAVALATAKAMAAKDDRLLQILATWGLLKQDNRQVERKKPGQPKARKHFTWVKR